MTEANGFELLYEKPIPELNSRAQLWRHVKTGAELLAILNDDENKMFGVAFRTLPRNHTGVAHIMEHSVLGGSQKYPVKEPFVELIKGSLATFVNAMTGLDMTIYPLASQNLQDFYNLMDVYLDAVFYPTLSQPTFQQEGWHYELAEEEADLAYRGIVFNEMKGNYSTGEYALMRAGMEALFPDNAYGLDAGGDPRHIPELTYEQFKAFYTTYYHPSNARFFLYGNTPVEESLRRVNAYLANFQRAPVPPDVELQAPFAAPLSLTAPYPVGEDAERQKYYATVNWVAMANDDPAQMLAFDILNYALIGSPASPLRKALVDSGLGEDLAGLPQWFRMRQAIFSVGLKGVAPEDADKVEPLVLQTLAALARDGLERETVEAAVNTVEFELRENDAEGGQRGLALMTRALGTWLHGGDPLALAAFEEPLGQVKAALAANPRYLEEMVRRYLLDNPHRLTLLLRPDPELQRREEAAEAERLALARAAMPAEQRRATVENTRALRAFQEAPNSPEALATLPVLKRGDLDRSVKRIPLEVGEEAGSPVFYHPLPTNGIVYLDLGFDLRSLPQEVLPYVTVLGRTLLEMGTQKEDMVRLTQRIGRSTGGIEPALLVSEARRGPGPVRLFLRGKAMAGKSEELLAILRDVLLTVRLDNRERFRQIVLEEKSRREEELLWVGHRMVYGRLRAHFYETGWAGDLFSGIGSILAIRQLAEEVERDWPGVLSRLEAIRAMLVNRSTMLANVTADAPLWPHLRPTLASFLQEIPAAAPAPAQWARPVLPVNEGFSAPAQVNYVGKGADLYALGYSRNGSALVINKYLNTTWLWEKVRAQGGAYGGMALLNTLSGMFSYLSYRDPHLLATIENYDGTPDFLRRLRLDEAELTKSIIGTIGELDEYELPAEKGFTSLAWYLTGQTDESRQQLRDEVLATNAADFAAFAQVLEAVREQGQVAVLGSEDSLQAANAQRGGNWLTVSRVL